MFSIFTCFRHATYSFVEVYGRCIFWEIDIQGDHKGVTGRMGAPNAFVTVRLKAKVQKEFFIAQGYSKYLHNMNNRFLRFSIIMKIWHVSFNVIYNHKQITLKGVRIILINFYIYKLEPKHVIAKLKLNISI